MQLSKKIDKIKNEEKKEESYTTTITETISDLKTQFLNYFSFSNSSTSNLTNCATNFNVYPPFPYSYTERTLNLGITGPFQLGSGPVFATRVNRLVTLSFNQVSITGNGNSSVINFPQLPTEYTNINSGINSFPVDVIQAGIITPGRVYMTGTSVIVGAGPNCSAFTGSTNLQGYLAFNITYID